MLANCKPENMYYRWADNYLTFIRRNAQPPPRHDAVDLLDPLDELLVVLIPDGLEGLGARKNMRQLMASKSPVTPAPLLQLRRREVQSSDRSLGANGVGAIGGVHNARRLDELVDLELAVDTATGGGSAVLGVLAVALPVVLPAGSCSMS